MRRRLFVGSLVLACAACGADEAVLELELDVPVRDPSCPAPSPAWFQVEALFQKDSGEPGSCGFNRPEWGLADRGPVEALPTEASPYAVSIVAAEGDFSEPLCVRVRYCVGADCNHIEDETGPGGSPTAWAGFAIERAFYANRRTRLLVDSLPGPCDAIELASIRKCEVAGEGCASGDLSSWCDDDGRHFCE